MWNDFLQSEFEKPYFIKLKQFLAQEKEAKKIIFPDENHFFDAFTATPFEKVRVVILGQDPYHGENQAHGLAFSVPKNQKKIPPSLKNIFKEAGIQNPLHGNLEHWAEQGVLLINATLSVEKGKAGSHQNKGWEVFTESVIQTISEKKKNIIFVLWGNFALSKKKLIDEAKHTILTAPHPSPLSAYKGFFGCGHFIKINEILKNRGEKEIRWELL